MAGVHWIGGSLIVLGALTACHQSEQARERAAQERAATHATVARSAVVQSLATPRQPGRLIYDKPTDLSYTSLRATRPDLDSAARVRTGPRRAAHTP